MSAHEPVKERIDTERYVLLHQLERAAEQPLAFLGFVWLALVVTQFIGQPNHLVDVATWTIWSIFLLDFAIKFFLAPSKLPFLRKNWLTVLSLALPALRLVSFARVLTMFPATDARLLRVLTTANRAFSAVGATMGRRGIKYVLTMTAIVIALGAAGMYAFERDAPGTGIHSYFDAAWWVAMVMTTLGSDYFPETAGGRILCFLLAVFAFSIFGYITAAVASHFVQRDAEDREKDDGGAERAGTAAILEEVRALRAAVERLEKRS